MNLDSLILIKPIDILWIIPILVLLVFQLKNNIRKSIQLTDLEFIYTNDSYPWRHLKYIRFILLLLIVVGLGLIIAMPQAQLTNKMLSGSRLSNDKQFVVVFDVSSSMNITMEEVRAERKILTAYDNERNTRYDIAREALYDFMEKFNEDKFGLVIFSTSSLLARWPTNDLSDKFMEIFEESIRRGSETQLEKYAKMTNTDQAIYLAGDIFEKTKSVQENVIILITDGWDDISPVEKAIRDVRSKEIRFYTIGVGIPDEVVTELRIRFQNDSGFKIFNVNSKIEMEQAYDLVGGLETTSTYQLTGDGNLLDVRWIFALVLSVFSCAVIFISECVIQHSYCAEN